MPTPAGNPRGEPKRLSGSVGEPATRRGVVLRLPLGVTFPPDSPER